MPEVVFNEKLLSEIVGADVIRLQYANYSLPDYDKYIQELATTGVELSEDPSQSNLSDLNMKIAQIDAQKTRASVVANMATANENELEMIMTQAQSLWDHEYNKLLISTEIRQLPNKELREAAASVVLFYLKELLTNIKASLSRAKTFSKIVSNNVSMLDSANKNISRQITVLQLQMGIGEIGRGPNPHTF